jgi:hypothetical protein
MIEISFTIFKNIFDNKTHRRIDLPNFDAFEKFLYKLASEPKASRWQIDGSSFERFLGNCCYG